MPIGKWLDLKGYDMKPNVKKEGGVEGKGKTPPPPPPAKEVKPPKEEKPPPPFEPWLDTFKGEFKPIRVQTHIAVPSAAGCIS